MRHTSGLVAAVAKMADEDPETAQLFVQLSLFNTMADLIEQAGPVLEADTDLILAEGSRVAKRSLLSVSKSMSEEEIEDVALATMVIDAYLVKKGLVGDALRSFNEKHLRDSRGRFVRTNLEFSEHFGQGTDERHRESHKQVEAKVKEWKDAGLINDETELHLHYKKLDDQGNLISGPDEEEQPIRAKAGKVRQEMDIATSHDNKRMVHAISFSRGSIPKLGDGEAGEPEQRRAALDAMLTFAGPENATQSARLAGSLPKKGDWTQAGQDWNRPGTWNDRKVYRRMELTGRALSAATVPGSTANTVGQLARLTGTLGPEAEKVLGPGMRRTAYRYRGTERRPRSEMIAQNKAANNVIAEMEDPNKQANFNVDLTKTRKTGHFGSGAFWMQHGNEYNLTPDQMRLLTHGDTMAISLVNERYLPDLNAAALSLQAGEQPPSVGVIIDADGDLVTHAQGFNGDHYLPFDLKNLKQLQGGQYVRTRAAGGLTSEDLYTGLLAGARQVQVVSNSGVFTLEFDPDVRGSRRYTDKALRMINRYGKILETIGAGKIVLNDVSPAERSELRAEARRIARSKEEVNQTFNDLLEEARTNQEAPDEDEIYNAAAATVDIAARSRTMAGRPMSSQERAREIDTEARKLITEFREKQVRRLALDGQGYGAAMSALQQEFPFFIRRAFYEPLPRFLAARGQEPEGQYYGPKDAGFVERGQTNPRRAEGAPRYDLGRPESVGDKKVVEERKAEGLKRTAAGTPLRTGQKETVSLADAIKPDEKLGRAVAARFGKLVRPLEAWGMQGALVAPDAFSSDDHAMQEGGLRLLHYRLMMKSRRDPAVFTKWLVNEATPEQRKAIHEGLEDLDHTMAGLDDASRDDALLNVATWEEWQTDVASLKTAVDAMSPFEKPTENWAETRPSTGVPRPQAIPEIVALGNNVEAYDQYGSRQASRDSGWAGVLKDVARKTPSERRDSVNGMLDELEDQLEGSTERLTQRAQVERFQRAWAYAVARDIAENLKELEESLATPASGASPKVEKAAGPPSFLQQLVNLSQSLQELRDQ